MWLIAEIPKIHSLEPVLKCLNSFSRTSLLASICFLEPIFHQHIMRNIVAHAVNECYCRTFSKSLKSCFGAEAVTASANEGGAKTVKLSKAVSQNGITKSFQNVKYYFN